LTTAIPNPKTGKKDDWTRIVVHGEALESGGAISVNVTCETKESGLATVAEWKELGVRWLCLVGLTKVKRLQGMYEYNAREAFPCDLSEVDVTGSVGAPAMA
jgi:hypothetical protein